MIDPSLTIAASILTLCLATAATARDDKRVAVDASGEPVIACSLSSPQLRERIAKIREELLPAVTAVIDLPDGYELVVPNEASRIRKLAEMVELESQCCAFIDFEIRLGAGSDTLSLVMTGPAGTREALEGLAAGARARAMQ